MEYGTKRLSIKSQHMTKQWVLPLGGNVLDTGKIGGDDYLGVSDKIIPAHSKDHKLAMHMEGLEIP